MSLDLQLSELRRALDVATTKIDGQLAVLLQKSDYAEQRARETADRFAAELAARDIRLAAHETRMTSIEDDVTKGFTSVNIRVYFLMGIMTAISSGAGILAGVLTSK